MKRALTAAVMTSGALLALAVLSPAPSAAQRSDSLLSRPSRPATVMRANLRQVGTFTPAVQDPRLAAALGVGRSGLDRSFHFTPAGGGDRDRQVRVAVRARPGMFPSPSQQLRNAAAAPVQPTPSQPAFASSSYNLGTSIGWRRFAITGDVERNDNGIVPGMRESARVGVDYRATRRLTGRVEVGTERAEGVQRIVGDARAYNVDVGGSYSITRNIDVTGGVRYRMAQDRLEPLVRDERRDSQAVYIGTAFRF